MRSAALFAFLGFLASVVSGLGADREPGAVIEAGLLWAVGFAFLGWGIGRVARLVAIEVVDGRAARAENGPDSGSCASQTADNQDEGTRDGSDRRPGEGETPLPNTAIGVVSSERPARGATKEQTEAQGTTSRQ
ncbi:MAG: hypothetical protein ACO4BJ_05365 [Planctomycetota bacterium]